MLKSSQLKALHTSQFFSGAEADPRCLSIRVPDDDVHLRRSNVRCLNLTRAITYQRLGCVSNNVPGERVSFVLSHHQGIGSQTFSQRAPLMVFYSTNNLKEVLEKRRKAMRIYHSVSCLLMRRTKLYGSSNFSLFS